ncbi:MAG: efflux RND transporter periplasmic adaptor subunit [Acidaminococcaceae bacterium]|nr:efflux RND transporter periplasmic adaptor subunit [Acidaminococcaceae bacterium]
MLIKEKLQAWGLTKKRLYLIIGVIIIIAIGGRIASDIFGNKNIAKTIPIVRTITVGNSATANILQYPGEVRGRYESSLAFQIAGKIVSRSVNLGDKVTAGQVLMQIDPKDVIQTVNSSAAALNSAESQYQLAAKNAQRYQELYNSGAVSKATAEQYENAANAALATLQQAQARLSADNHQLEYTKLVADHDGVIAAVNGEIGMVVAAGTSMVTLVQNGQREIQIFVPENQLSDIHPGQPVQVDFWALNKVKVNGTISEIAPMADSTTRTYKVRVALDNVPSQVKLGMTAKVILAAGDSTDFIIPSSAIYQTGDKPHVWLVVNKHVQLIPIEIKGYRDNDVVIKSGLKKGDVVVSGGVNKLTANDEVRLEDGGTL